MSGPTGGVQGMEGSLFGVYYQAGSWQDKLIEAFSGSHDMIGGKISGLYDEQGNAKRDMTNAEKFLYDRWAEVAIPLASPFAFAETMPPEIWKAISIFLKAAR
jgi:filamentous hemagglutinin